MTPDGGFSPRSLLHTLLVDGGRGDAFDRHVFACAVAAAANEAPRPLCEGLGLAPDVVRALFDAYFPSAAWAMLVPCLGESAGEEAIEEPDMRTLLVSHRSSEGEAAIWLAAIVARRSLRPNHLWQDLGLRNRSELGQLLRTHFAPLAARNDRDMKWKKFFYRELCQQDGVLVCKSPVCDVCSDFQHCFGGEE
ncbi:MAG TPA: nitrogen fixation protein NifQ [Rhodocyclaceae bacterium]|nr:nitrogen fixation protein NifQ [Rhodocyclaceae bacterium]